MITVRPANERGHANLGWLDTYHTFSFNTYYDPRHMGFRALRVINEDRVAPRRGFGTHGHRDMEIITYVLEGELSHKDSMGTGSTILPDEVQRMSAGTGVLHSEKNQSPTGTVHLLQIWIEPEKAGIEPSYEQKRLPPEEKKNRLRLLASRHGREGSVTIHQDAELYASVLDSGISVAHALPPGRHGWLQVVRGTVSLNGTELKTGDGAAMSDEPRLEITAREPSELLLFDLA